MAQRILIGQLLVKKGLIDETQLKNALAYQAQWGVRLGRAVVALGFVPEAELLRAVGEQLGIPFVEIGNLHVPEDVLKRLPEKIMRARHVFPLELVSPRGPLAVALSDAGNLACLDEISFAAGIPVRPVLAIEADVDRAIVRHLGGIMPGTAERPDAIELPDEPVEETMDLVEAPHTPRSHN